MAAVETRDKGDNYSRDAGLRRWRFAEAYDGMCEHNGLVNINARNCIQYDRMMGLVRGRYTRTIGTVAVVGYASGI